MKLGIGLPNPVPGTGGDTLLRWSREAEERGFSSVATIDRIAYPSYESLIALAAAAAVTTRIGLMTNILLGPTRNPILLAKESASLDQLSGGRFTLGLGVGARPDDFELAERSFSDRGKRWDKDLEAIHRAWRGEPVGGDGKALTPTPRNGQSVPILIGGMSDRALDRTLRWGKGWTAGGAPAEMVAPFVERLKKAWTDGGRSGEPFVAALTYFSLGDEVKDDSVAYLRDYYGQAPWAEELARGIPRSAGSIREAVAKYEEIGVDELFFDPTVSDISQIERLAEVVF